MIRTFSYPASCEPAIRRISKRAEKEGMTFSELVIEAVKLYAAKHYPETLEKIRVAVPAQIV